MAKSGGGAGRGRGGGVAAYSGSRSDSFFRKVSSAYKSEYYIRKGSSSLSNSEINRAVRMGILERHADGTYTMRT